MRKCYVCSRDLPLDQFGLNRTKPEGRTLECRDCRREYSRKWREANPDKDRTASQRWRDAHPERARERITAWREKNDRKPQDVIYRERHRDEIRVVKGRSRAKVAGVLIVDEVDIRALIERDGGCCQICSAPVDLTAKATDSLGATVDHIIPLSLGGEHSYANTQLAHFFCNTGKREGRQAASAPLGRSAK